MEEPNNMLNFPEEEEVETISLSDFPTKADAPENDGGVHDRRFSSDPVELFEFFSGFTSYKSSHAEEIIFCGKLMHLNGHIPKNADEDRRRVQSFHGRRCESSSSIYRTNSSGSKSARWQLPRSSRSLDYKKLRTCTVEIARSSSKSKIDVLAQNKPRRWYVMMFGQVKFPPEMDLQDMKNRQVRRSVSPMFHSDDRSNTETGRSSTSTRNDRKSLWDFINVLSCKNDASVAVTTSFDVMTAK